IGHTVDRCFELVGYPTGYVKKNFNANTRHVSSNNATRSNSPVSLSNEQLARLMILLNDNVFQLLMPISQIVDSGANQHMAVSAKFLINVVDISNLCLTYTVRLLYVHKLARDNKSFVGFDESKCYIQDLKANKTVGIGNQCNELYLFDVDNVSKIVSNNCIASCSVSKTLWHQRIGHPVDQVLDVLKTALNLDSHSTSDHLCDTCNKAKQTREPFPLSDHKSTKIRQLVHLDVWGPYKVINRDGFRYF
ncbi:ribonuclease H-like domain-containing protein, partial [Tanacetum coccineum]